MYVISDFKLSNLRPEGLAISLKSPVVRTFLHIEISTHLKGK